MRKTPWIRSLALLLAVATLAVTTLGGCSIVTRGSDFCYKFLDHIINEQFDQAYEMLADSIKAPESAEERDARLKVEEAEKAEKKKFWKELFGLEPITEDGEGKPQVVSAEATDTPAPETPTPSPTPTATPEPTIPPVMENGYTPNPETGEYPDITATPTPEPVTPTPELADEPGTPDESPTPEPDAPKRGKTTPTPDPEETPAPVAVDENGNPIVDKTITKVTFIEKYQSIFDEMEITGVEYETTDVVDGEIIARVNYTMTYHSDRAKSDPDVENGDLTYDFVITANRIEHRWTIDWSPSLIFPDMQWGDNLRVGTLQANRGEILCDGEAYAQNVATVTVFAVPSTIEDEETFVKETVGISELEMTEEDVRKALANARNDFSKLKTFFPDEIDAGLKSRILAVKGLAIDSANYGSLRYYPFGESLCHIIGYAGIIAKKEKTNYEVYGDVTYNQSEDRFETDGTTRYNGDSWIGKYGLELLYEDKLLGTNGRFTYIQTPTGGSRGMLYRDAAVEGMDLHLTIMPELQERLESVVDTVVYDDSIHGCVIVFNPQTGAIQAMTSWPGFDLNYLARGMPEEEWAALENDPTIPLYNRATQGLYTPGSIFKPMTSAAMLETQTMTANDVFPGSETIHDDEWMPSETFMNSLQDRASTQTFYDQAVGKPLKRTRSDSRPTPMNLTNSIISSDNLFFAYSALRMGWNKYSDFFINKLHWETPISLEAEGTSPRIYWKADADGISWTNVADGGNSVWTQDKDGKWTIYKTSAGYETRLVLDKMIWGLDVSTSQLCDRNKKVLPSEYADAVAKWKEQNPESVGEPDIKVQNDYDLSVTGYGQGQIMVTPLQMAYFLSAYANNGDVMQPYLVDSIWHADGTEYSLVEQRTPKVLYKQFVQQSTVDTLLLAMMSVCTEGTARFMYKSFITKREFTDLGYTFAGKTGTAEITNDKSRELAWFGCWRQYRNGEPVSAEDARMVVVMLEVNLPLGTEWSQMKFDIARALLKYDVLNDNVDAEGN